jgi:hypothetical protein
MRRKGKAIIVVATVINSIDLRLKKSLKAAFGSFFYSYPLKVLVPIF